MSDLAARRQLNRGYDDGWSRAVELVATPLVIGGFGALVDAWLGTRPAFMIGLGVVGVVGIFVKLWLGYDREMREHEASGPWARRGGPDERPPAKPLKVPGYASVTAAAVSALRSRRGSSRDSSGDEETRGGGLP